MDEDTFLELIEILKIIAEAIRDNNPEPIDHKVAEMEKRFH